MSRSGAGLPLDQVLRGDGQAPENTLGAAPFVQEALRWLTGGARRMRNR